MFGKNNSGGVVTVSNILAIVPQVCRGQSSFVESGRCNGCTASEFGLFHSCGDSEVVLKNEK